MINLISLMENADENNPWGYQERRSGGASITFTPCDGNVLAVIFHPQRSRTAGGRDACGHLSRRL